VGKVLNVTDPDSIAACLEAIRTDLSDPLVLVNNAGITQDNLLMRMKEEEWHSVVDTNLNALYRLSKACLRGMTKAKWGRVINITSVVGAMATQDRVTMPLPRRARKEWQGHWRESWAHDRLPSIAWRQDLSTLI